MLLSGCGASLPSAQKQVKLPRVGYLAGSAAADDQIVKAFHQGLQALGYVEGQTITVDHRYTEGRPERLPDLLAELLALKPDVIVAWGQFQAIAAKQATDTIPIVFQTGQPIELGLVRSLAWPGGNITGVIPSPSGLYAKRLQLLKEAFPAVSRVGYLSPSGPTGPIAMELQEHAPRLGVQLQALHVPGPDDLANAFATAIADDAEALMVADDPWVFTYRAQIIDWAAQQRLPAMYFRREYVTDGGLMSYGQNILNSARRVAVYVDKILKGANPGEIPVEQPTTIDFAVNRTTLTNLGLMLPPDVAAQVTEWVE
jgi:putative ABC transport system substrate-binding protein